MCLKDAPTAYTFDDFTLNPCHSTLKSRKDPNVSTIIGGHIYDIPVISAPMNTVTELEMMRVMYNAGGSSVLHRFMSLETQCKIINEYLISDSSRALNKPFYVAVGATGDYLERVEELYQRGTRCICVDVANGHSKICIDAVLNICKRFSDIVVMAGNVCNYDGARRLSDVGCKVLRVGIGSGAMCITRLVTGHGVPQLTALEDCLRIKKDLNVTIVSDGGIRNSGDCVKALALGADAVMIGAILAGTDQSPGKVFNDNGHMYKTYAGMASEEGRAEWFESEATSFVPEGVATKILFKGSANKVLQNFIGGLKVGMSYCDARNLKELQSNAQWVRITNAGVVEGTPHGKK